MAKKSCYHVTLGISYQPMRPEWAWEESLLIILDWMISRDSSGPEMPVCDFED